MHSISENNFNINGFELPIKVKYDSDYVQTLIDIFCKYIDEIKQISNDELIHNINLICCNIIKAFNRNREGQKVKAKEIISSIIKYYIGDEFWVSELDKSYAFRGIAPLDNTFDNMLNYDLSFYRARIACIETPGIKDLVHLPYSKKDKADEGRFSVKGQPCLYLGTTSYICSQECGWEKGKCLLLSGFKFNNEGKKLKILNLAVNEGLINGIFNEGIDSGDNRERRQMLKKGMLTIFPLIIATSFNVENSELKYEYVISQILMKAIKDLKIDGIAYMSKNGNQNDCNLYPHGVNLAIPASDISPRKEYSDICKKFHMTKPSNVGDMADSIIKKESFINKNYKRYYEKDNWLENYISFIHINGEKVFYGDTMFSVIDDVLMSKDFYDVNLNT